MRKELRRDLAQNATLYPPLLTLVIIIIISFLFLILLLLFFLCFLETNSLAFWFNFFLLCLLCLLFLSLSLYKTFPPPLAILKPLLFQQLDLSSSIYLSVTNFITITITTYQWLLVLTPHGQTPLSFLAILTGLNQMIMPATTRSFAGLLMLLAHPFPGITQKPSTSLLSLMILINRIAYGLK